MKIAVTGASGYIGTQLIKSLLNSKHELLLFGRSINKLHRQFPTAAAADYNSLGSSLSGTDVVIHLAVKNNDSQGSKEEFRAANVNLLSDLAKNAALNRVKLFINLTTLHSETNGGSSEYGRTKAEGRKTLDSIGNLQIVNLILPAVYAPGRYRGNLAALNYLPRFLRGFCFLVLSTFRPTLNISILNRKIITLLEATDWPIKNLYVSDEQKHNAIYSGLKRASDLLFACAVATILSPILIAAWIAIKMDSRGPAIFKQKRVGIFGEVFLCYKFRTMAIGTKQAGSHEVGISSITRVGKFLRKTKIDELPQIVNIVRNEMSLVGPRPSLPSQLTLIDARHSLRVFDVRPGITGLAQINGIDMSTPELLAEYDARYIACRSLLLDLKILIATFFGRGMGDAVGADRSS